MNQNEEILKTIWGHDHFRPGQADIITAVLEGNDVLALLPTGGGKSICYQLPAMKMEGLCLVVSPLIALMRDQVYNLKLRGIKAVAIYAGMKKREIDIVLDNCIYGNCKFLYVSPERITTSIFQERVKKMNICLVAVDEAHCISQWGYDFRPPYLKIATLRNFLSDVNFIALTASATPAVQDDIVDKLKLENTKLFKQSFSRANLSYSVLRTENKEDKLVEILTSVNGSKIVYVASRKGTKEIANHIKSAGISANYYHAGLSKEERAQVQEDWIKNKFNVIVATNAFGMGIDKPDVRIVVHYEMPSNLESYYQEAGRAGRDGKKSYAVVLYYDRDLELTQRRFDQSSPTIDKIKKCYQSMANYLKLAVGSGEMASFDFDIAEFSKIYGFDSLDSYYCLKKLETEGIIQLNEGFYSPSKVIFNSDKKELYKFQIAHANFDNLIKSLLRMYGGELFSEFCSIDEAKISTILSEKLTSVKKGLNALHDLNIITYLPQTDKPQLTLLTPRLDPGRLPIDTKALEKKLQQDQHRIDAVKHYVKNKHQCRTQQLVNYFGENNDDLCGICDWCTKRKSGAQNPTAIGERVLEVLEGEALSPNDIFKRLNFSEEKEFSVVLQSLLDNQKIYYLPNGLLARC